MIGRYGQLSYTSFDAAGTAGGWQVKQTSGELTASETQTLVSGVRTAFQPVEPLPAYPTPEECERGPRRLAYRRTPGDAAAYWHSVPAGADSTGRPGNVFAHVVLDRTPDLLAPHRPIELWRSPGWLRPYGPTDVARAELPDAPPAPTNVVDKASVLAFALDTSIWRLGTLYGLLDAVLAAMNGGPQVVLGVRSDESAAQWIGLVSMLMSPGTAARLSFSTFDRADQLPAAMRAGQHLTAVPIADLPAVPDGLMVIDETATLSMGELGGQPHRTADGRAITVTPWSAMAQVTLLDPKSASVVIDDIVHYATAVGDRGLHPAWPMAMSVINRDDFTDGREEAQGVIAAFSPTDVTPDSALAQTISGVLADSVGANTADAWRAVQQAPQGRAAEHADLIYLCRAVTDPDWLGQSAMIPASPRPAGVELPAELSTAIDAGLQAAADDPERLIRLADLLLRSGVRDHRVPDALTAPEVAAALADPQVGPALVHQLDGRIDAASRLTLAAATLRIARPRDGFTTISDPVLEWFADGVGVPPVDELAGAALFDPTWTDAALRGAHAQRFGPTDAADRFAQLWWLRMCGSARFDDLAATGIWDPAELLVAAGGGPLSADAVLPTLLGTATSADLDRLATALEASTDPMVAACAEVRLIDPRVWVQHGFVDTQRETYTPLWDAAVARVGLPGLHPDVGVRLLTLAAVARINGKPIVVCADALAAHQDTAEAVIEQVVTLVDQQVLPAAEVLAASLIPVAADDGDTAATGVDAVLAAAAEQLVATREFTDEDVDAAIAALARLTGIGAEDAPPRRYRKMVHKLLSQRPEGQSSLAARIRGSR